MPETSPETSRGRGELLELTSDIVSAYASNNALPSTDLPQLIETVYRTLSAVGAPATGPETEQKPAVSIKKSVTSGGIICLECGREQKMLKRHLGTAHGITPEEYRAKWRLPYDYPMVAPDYAEKRRQLAKQIGLGRKPTKAAPKRKRKT